MLLEGFAFPLLFYGAFLRTSNVCKGRQTARLMAVNLFRPAPRVRQTDIPIYTFFLAFKLFTTYERLPSAEFDSNEVHT